MSNSDDIGYFLDPKSVAVLGVSRQPGGWGSGIFEQVVTTGSQRRVYPINSQATEINGIKAYPNMMSIPDEVELAVIAVPVQSTIEMVQQCIPKGVKAILMVTAGFGETPEGQDLQRQIAEIARNNNIRIIGPNVSGIFNVSANFNASRMVTSHIKGSPISFICQGGFAVNNVLLIGSRKGMGAGKYIHTGNECDLTCTDFLEYLGDDPSTKVILMHIEGLRDGPRFLRVAQRISKEKPIIVFKTGGTEAGARAASSHTGTLAGSDIIYNAMFKQANIIRSPKMENMLEFGHAFLELPPLMGNRVGIITMGGTWGVAIADALVNKGMIVPCFSQALQEKLREAGNMPYWASTRNPIDIGAAGRSPGETGHLKLIEALLASEEIDAVIVHGMGQIGFRTERMPLVFRVEEETIRAAFELIPKYNKPLMICSQFTQDDSGVIRSLIEEGRRFYHDIEDMTTVLASLHTYYMNRENI